MAYTVAQLIEGQIVVCAERQETVRVALERMIENDFSQLPVVGGDGYLLGLLSDKSIARANYFLNNNVGVLDLAVDNCLAKAVMISPDAEVFDAQTRLREAPALIVVESKRPIGVLTNYDTARFFSDVGEGLMYVEDIETGLRRYIEALFDTKAKLDAALFHAFGPDKHDPMQPAVVFDKMAFYQHVQFITQEKNWPTFEPYFSNRNVMRQVMEGVREIRNQLAHFRDPLNPVQREALLHARDWLSVRPKPTKLVTVSDTATVAESVSVQLEPSTATGAGNLQVEPVAANARGTIRYATLQAWLTQRPVSVRAVEQTFRNLEEILGTALPESARMHTAWWTNDAANYPQSRSWLTAGWQVSEVDLEGESVVFERSHEALYQPFFVDLLARVQQLRPGFASGISAGARNWLDFASGRPGFRLAWSFTRERSFRVELGIDTGDKERNAAFFAALESKREEIETKFGSPLDWDPLPHRRTCRVSIQTLGSISDSTDQLNKLLDWGAETMIRFAHTLLPYIENLP